MKKIIFSVLTVVLLAMLCITPVFATNETANVSSVSGNRGATITVTVSLSKATTVGSGGIELVYDTAVLELVKGEWDVSGTALATFNTSNGKGAFAYAGGTQISGKIFTATFKIKSNAAFGDSVVKMILQLKDGSNVDIAVTNNSGKITVTCNHSYSAWSSVNGTTHTRTCSICQGKENANHAFTNACDTTCDTCGYTRTITHSYKSAWSSNGTQHWHECSVCKDKKDTSSHTPGPAATETTAQTCTTCGHVIQAALGHTHKPTGEWLSDGNSHWHACSTCDGKADKASHSYDNACDEDCNVCGYKRTITHKYATVWSSDKDGHWHACTVCGEKDSLIAHVPGAEATEETPQLCTVCQYELVPPKVHEHKYEGNYINDAGHHWKDCQCGEHSEKEAHIFGEGKIVTEPTNDKAGKKEYTCSACGYVKTVELENYAATSGNSAGNGGFSIVSMLIGIVIGVAVTAGIFIVIKKKK